MKLNMEDISEEVTQTYLCHFPYTTVAFVS